MSLVVVLAHQGGWDEMLMVVAPIAAFALILRRANRRAEALAATRSESAGATGNEPSGVPTVPDAPSVQPGDVGPE